MKPLAQLKRSCSIGLGILALALPLVISTMDTSAAPPKTGTSPAAATDPPADPDESSTTKDDRLARKVRNIKLNYVNASWTKVLQDFAEATQTEVVADRVPASKFSRWDMKFYNRDEALAILNTELKPHNYRLQIKGHYLVVNALHEFRQEYAPAVLRGSRVEQPGSMDENAVQTATAALPGEAVVEPLRTRRADGTRPKQSPTGQPSAPSPDDSPAFSGGRAAAYGGTQSRRTSSAASRGNGPRQGTRRRHRREDHVQSVQVRSGAD